LNSSIETIQKPGGTYAYFAPEHFKDECSPKIDIWACGLILYYLLDGKIYFYDSIRDEMKKNILYKTVTFEGISFFILRVSLVK
jgi:serine/threonine protein kinase